MKEFIKRNSPVFVIGIITLIVFLIITAISKVKKEYYVPSLIRLSEEQKQELEYIETQPETEVIENEIVESEKPLRPEEITKQYDERVIEFTEDGFSPQNDQAYQYTTIRWVNKTNMPMTIEQVSNTYTDFEPIEIPVQGTGTFIVTKLKTWIYKETITDEYGSIFVLKED